MFGFNGQSFLTLHFYALGLVIEKYVILDSLGASGRRAHSHLELAGFFEGVELRGSHPKPPPECLLVNIVSIPVSLAAVAEIGHDFVHEHKHIYFRVKLHTASAAGLNARKRLCLLASLSSADGCGNGCDGAVHALDGSLGFAGSLSAAAQRHL